MQVGPNRLHERGPLSEIRRRRLPHCCRSSQPRCETSAAMILACEIQQGNPAMIRRAHKNFLVSKKVPSKEPFRFHAINFRRRSKVNLVKIVTGRAPAPFIYSFSDQELRVKHACIGIIPACETCRREFRIFGRPKPATFPEAG